MGDFKTVSFGDEGKEITIFEYPGSYNGIKNHCNEIHP